MTTRLFLDTRAVKDGKSAPVKVSISHRGKTAYIPTNISVTSAQWDKSAEKVVGHPHKSSLNMMLTQKKLEVDEALNSLARRGVLHGVDAARMKSMVESELNPDKEDEDSLFMPLLRAYTESLTKEGTRKTYINTIRKIEAFDKNAQSLRFEDIDKAWLVRFVAFLSKTSESTNYHNIILRNIRTIFNLAIDDEKTTAYPFRKFRIRPEPTKSRAVSADTLRRLTDTPSPYTKYQDIFRLSFLLGGINICDLCLLRKADVLNGRIETLRIKTSQFLGVPITPMAQAIIDKYAGREHLLDIAENLTDYKHFLWRMNKFLKRVGQTYDPHAKTFTGEPVCPSASSYYARYTFATIAADLGFPKEVIAACLGHAGNKSVTDIYIRVDMSKKVDECVRAVQEAVYG